MAETPSRSIRVRRRLRDTGPRVTRAGRNAEAEEAMQRAAELHAEADEDLDEDEEQDNPGQN